MHKTSVIMRGTDSDIRDHVCRWQESKCAPSIVAAKESDGRGEITIVAARPCHYDIQLRTIFRLGAYGNIVSALLALCVVT